MKIDAQTALDTAVKLLQTAVLICRLLQRSKRSIGVQEVLKKPLEKCHEAPLLVYLTAVFFNYHRLNFAS